MDLQELAEYLQVLETLKNSLDKLKYTSVDISIIGLGPGGEGFIRVSFDLSSKEAKEKPGETEV